VTDARLNVLLVEDEAMNRALVRAIIARQVPTEAGVVLREAETLAAARDVLANEPVDVVLLDVRLPDGNGLRLAEEIRARGTDAHGRAVLPMIAILSASVLTTERDEAEGFGPDAFLGKPFAPQDLVALLGRFGDEVRRRRSDGSPST
jgi:CheY-like chemotaxis protein